MFPHFLNGLKRNVILRRRDSRCDYRKKANNLLSSPVSLAYTSYESTESVIGEVPSPVVIHHCLLGSKMNWVNFSKALHRKTQPKRRIIAVDCRNHGESPHTGSHSYLELVADIKLLLKQLNVEKISFLGHCMGGLIGMLFALQNPEKVEKLLIADQSPIKTPYLASMASVLRAMEAVSFPKNVTLGQIKWSVDNQLARRLADKNLRSFLINTNLVKKSDGNFGWRVNIPTLTAYYTSESDHFPKIQKMKYEGPVLFVYGESSNYILRKDFPEIKKIFPKAEFKAIESAPDQLIQVDKSVEFLQICLDFFNKDMKMLG